MRLRSRQWLPFPLVLRATQRYRREHGTSAYAYSDGSFLCAVTAAAAPRSILEVGTALGYTALCLLDSAPKAHLHTIERDAGHAAMAQKHFEEYGMSDRVTLHQREARLVMEEFPDNSFDFLFFDGSIPDTGLIRSFERLLRPGGTLVCANLGLGGDAEEALSDPDHWVTHLFGETALCVRRPLLHPDSNLSKISNVSC